MGSGPSKDNAPARGSPVDGGAKAPVANVSSVPQVGESANRSKGESGQPVDFSPKKVQSRGKSPTDRNERGRTSRGNDWIPSERERPSRSSEAEVEVDDALDEVLRIPVDRSGARKPAATSQLQQDREPGESLPETYAQRRQREQYTLDQQLLLREKTIYRNPLDWLGEREVEDVHTGGFDASKFRMANQGKSGVQRDTPSSNKDDFVTSGSLETTQTWDDLDVTPKSDNSLSKLPVYDQSEMDILASLEREFL